MRRQDNVSCWWTWPCSLQCVGHRNHQTVKGVSFLGDNDEYVMSGSDDGHIYIWTRTDGVLRQWLRGDNAIVNCLEPHPFQPLTFATSGKIRLMYKDLPTWSPLWCVKCYCASVCPSGNSNHVAFMPLPGFVDPHRLTTLFIRMTHCIMFCYGI